ncbi:FAD-dependent oxidoreductase [Streptomyces sp. LP05-1]|uniref:FAD-dependent oxidoreductase n=1 Tax=Streptomyces pyxinae TaxID=2970734 RepID=A0ABT2CQ98_9ACTN|nr:FAD-dependent oxidoreductase [Streptomyces sp. LP05-1]MCS0639603.1 FAD-dependent oxidoreductase [Streptomyces sp. LP05-1]
MTAEGSPLPAGEPVLVVGAGPVGLTAAHELARHGVRVRLVDAAPGPATTSRALATHARTLETYDQMGVLDDVLPRGQRVEHFTLHQNGRRLIRFDTDYSELPTRYPFTLMIDQVITEEALRAAAARQGVEVEWGVRLTGFTDHGSGVRAELEHADGRAETFEAGWLVGCDGGHSTVRKQLGLKLVGESSETWLISDAVVHCDLPRDSIHWMRTPAGTVMMVPFPEPGKWRLLDTAEVSYDGDDAAVARRFARKIRTGTGREARVENPTWVSVFTIQQRMIPGMRKGRCLLAGDAAHVHSPASGQGMNTGVQDAVNLSWKLASVIHGTAGQSLLDSYSDERVPVGAALLKSTKFATLLVQLRSRTAAAALRALFTFVRSVPPLKSRIERKIMGGMSALDLGYGEGPPALGTAGEAGTGEGVPPVTDGRAGKDVTPVAGSAIPAGGRVSRVTAARAAESAGWRRLIEELRRPEWKLLTRPGGGPADRATAEQARRYEGVIRVLGIVPLPRSADGPFGALPDPDGRLGADLGIAPGGWLLIRPDGYAAASGGPADDPERTLAALGVRPADSGDTDEAPDTDAEEGSDHAVPAAG